MELSSFGDYMRLIRIKRKEVLGDMADKLGTSVAFLSAVEHGRKNIPPSWYDLIVERYDLDTEEKAKLRDAIDESRLQFKIVPNSTAGKNQRRAAMVFARSFETMDDKTALEIIKLLHKGDD